MTVISSASRYAYSPAFRARPSLGDEAVIGFSPDRSDQTDPDGGNAGNATRPPVTRRVEEAPDARFEFSLPYRSAFFHTAGKDGNGSAARDDTGKSRTAATDADDGDTLFGQPEDYGTAAAVASPADETSDSLPENPVDLLTSLLGGTS